MIKIGVIAFPGTNSEDETVRAFRRSGMDAEIVLWNDPSLLEGTRLSEFSGYCIAGGFSYEDRGRSGVVAAQQPIIQILKKEVEKGKLLLGICNGAQILIETGLLPGYEGTPTAAALAWNEMRQGGKVLDTGFYNTWVTLKNAAPRGRTAFNDFDDLLHIPMAHGEGRFVMEAETLKKVRENGQIVFQYADAGGQVNPEFPITPNGSTEAIAALCNPAGTVLGIMPHPERDPRGSGQQVFDSMRRWIESRKASPFKSLGPYASVLPIETLPQADLIFLVRLIITDNAERTLESALRQRGFKVDLSRYVYYGFGLEPGVDPKEAAQKIMATGEIANLNKETVQIFTSSDVLKLSPYVVTSDRGDFVGEKKAAAINRHAGKLVRSGHYGVLWHLGGMRSQDVEKVAKSAILCNPQSMHLFKPAPFPPLP